MWQESFPNCPVFIAEIADINSYISLSNSIKLIKKTPVSDGEKQSADKIRIIDNKWVPLSRLWVYLEASSWQTMVPYLLFPVYYPKSQCLMCFTSTVWPEGCHAKRHQHTRDLSVGVGLDRNPSERSPVT